MTTTLRRMQGAELYAAKTLSLVNVARELRASFVTYQKGHEYLEAMQIVREHAVAAFCDALDALADLPSAIDEPASCADCKILNEEADRLNALLAAVEITIDQIRRVIDPSYRVGDEPQRPWLSVAASENEPLKARVLELYGALTDAALYLSLSAEPNERTRGKNYCKVLGYGDEEPIAHVTVKLLENESVDRKRIYGSYFGSDSAVSTERERLDEEHRAGWRHGLRDALEECGAVTDLVGKREDQAEFIRSHIQGIYDGTRVGQGDPGEPEKTLGVATPEREPGIPNQTGAGSDLVQESAGGLSLTPDSKSSERRPSSAAQDVDPVADRSGEEASGQCAYVVEDLDGEYIGSLEYEPEVGNHGLSVNEANRIEHAYIFTDRDLASVIASLWGGRVIAVTTLLAYTNTDVQAWLVRAFKAGRAFEVAHPTPAPKERS